MVRCSDGTLINQEFDSRANLSSLIGRLVLIVTDKDGRPSLRFIHQWIDFENTRAARLVGVMKKISRLYRHFWVGTLKRRGSSNLGLVVYDPLARATVGSGRVVLYEVAESSTGEYREEVVRELIGGVDGYPDEKVEDAVNAYCRYAGIHT
jgi:hypothetical protein